MKKLAGPMTLVALLGAAATADARGVVGARVNPDPAAVRAYWTPERMRTAIPKDVVRPGGPRNPAAKPGGGGGGGGSTLGGATAVSWPSSSSDLTYTNGKVYFTDSGVRYVCSGTAINSANGSVVWTAGHCVNDGGSNRFYTDWMFVPAYNSPIKYATFTATHLYTSADWADSGEFGKDYGAAVVDQVGGKTLEATLGNIGRDLAFGANYTLNRPLDAYGYPAAGKFNGQKLYHCNSVLKYRDSASPDTMGIPCSMTGGSSGGAWLDPNQGNKQVSNNSYGYQSLKNVMFGPVFGPVAADLFHSAEGTGTATTVTHN
jgi:hypothetical protein